MSHRARWAVPLVSAALALTACGGGSAPATEGSEPVWSMVTDQAGLGDQGFNDLAKAGIDRSAADLGGRALVIQSTDQSQYVTNLNQASEGHSGVTTAVGSLLTDAVSEVAESRPDSRFTLIDSVATDPDGAPLSNVASVTFREQEGSFLAGVVAGLSTRTGRVGFIGGMEVPAVVRFQSGFAAGVAAVNRAARVDTAYVGSFADSARAKSLATGLYDGGADVVMAVAGGAGLGVFDAAKDRGPDAKVVGADSCQIQLAPDNVLTSVVKDVAGAVLRVNAASQQGTFTGGEINLGLRDQAIGLCEDNYGSLPADVRARVDAATAAIDAGTLVPPATPGELAGFRSPAF